MRIQFEPKDRDLFFNMISVYKIYAELSQRLKEENIEPPYSTIDILIFKMSEIIIDNKFYQITFEEDRDVVLSMIRFMLGTGIWRLNHTDMYYKFFIKDPLQIGYIEISRNLLFEYLLKNGLEV